MYIHVFDVKNNSVNEGLRNKNGRIRLGISVENEKWAESDAQ